LSQKYLSAMPLITFLLVLLSVATAAAASFDLPKRKSGLWEMKIVNAQAKGTHAVQQCIDEKTDDLMKKELSENRQPQCSKNEMRKEGEQIVVESVCKVQNSTVKTRAIFTGHFDSAYRADIKSSYEPPVAGMKEVASTIEAKRLGPCKAGQKPGDIVVPGMPNINMDAMRRGAPKRP
jgi:Protein of unknown function (DUF3617)